MKWFQKKAKLEYCVIYMNSGIRLETAVDEMIQKGWRPQGGISCMMTEKLIGGGFRSFPHKEQIWVQAMIREER